MFEDPGIAFVINAVQQAAQLVRTVQQQMIGEALTKDDRSPVTVGDFAAQALVAKLLADRFPEDRLVGEEDSASLREPDGRETLEQVARFVASCIDGATADDVCEWIDRGAAEATGRFWTLDPIDGTKGFLRGEQYAVALALMDNNRVELGALACPNLKPSGEPDIGGRGAVFVAARGKGSWAAPLDAAAGGDAFERIQVSDRSDPAEARLMRSVEAGHTHGGKIDDLAELLAVAAPPVRMDSQAKYAVLAAGGGELMLRLLSPSRPNYREKIWDQAAGSIVVEEAGGRVSDLDGKPLDFSHGRTLEANRGVVVSNGHVHEAVIAGLKQVGA